MTENMTTHFSDKNKTTFRPIFIGLFIFYAFSGLYGFSDFFSARAWAASSLKPGDFAALVEAGLSEKPANTNNHSVKKSSRTSISKVPMSSNMLDSITHISGTPSHQSQSGSNSGSASDSASSDKLSAATSRRLNDLNRAIEMKMKQITNKYSESKPVSNAGKTDMDEKMGDRLNEKMFSDGGDMFAVNSHSASRRKPAPLKLSDQGKLSGHGKVAGTGKAATEIPWSEVINSIKSMPESKVNDPIIKSAVSATVNMLSSPDFQSGFIKVVEKNQRSTNVKRGFRRFGIMGFMSDYLIPTIKGAVAGAATAAGNSYGQGPTDYAMNTLGGAIHGASQAFQNRARGR
ncbi:MAG: hypothetical protein CVV64_16575 [Candidatus Wallbacteria bacterium HGW-Wallbacteria-1]|jgi:hypothetical protein|uniref:Uncharacterized protein n=1 Tax=Candidatus Wallbacteria bacterium HGW-Wallbacteria-1 TaxID=2013854 RepID=A0A2N1PKR7_9BACT|nr:MAG: hypothetical protein CVV64_16575 [Candidatus Wallbacteria bacterium HGW-Wallbacteria-1]